MNKLILFSLVCTGFLVTMPVAADVLDTPAVNQNFNGETNVRLAQFRRNQNRDRQFTVYYRSANDRQWTREGSHTDRRDAERAARRLERRGYKTYVQVSREANRGMGRDRDMMPRR
jgi:CelD/BcsL family acetyltransferase involved in cellulose biosynthesis